MSLPFIYLQVLDLTLDDAQMTEQKLKAAFGADRLSGYFSSGPVA